MELILFRLFVFFSALALLVNMSLFSFYEYKTYEENKLYNSTESIRNENMAKQQFKPLCGKSKKQNSIYRDTINDCEALIPIEKSVDYGREYLYRSERYHEKAIDFLAIGFVLSTLLMLVFYSFRWIFTGKIKPIIPIRNIKT